MGTLEDCAAVDMTPDGAQRKRQHLALVLVEWAALPLLQHPERVHVIIQSVRHIMYGIRRLGQVPYSLYVATWAIVRGDDTALVLGGVLLDEGFEGWPHHVNRQRGGYIRVRL